MTRQLTSKFEDDLCLGPPSSYYIVLANFSRLKLRYDLIDLEYLSILIDVGLILNNLLAILAMGSIDKVGNSFQNSKVTGEGTVIRWIEG